jgi:novobiocin biosynthesis protein NovU/D-mycarose 3-C-methyltransferase
MTNISEKITACRICDSKDIKDVLDLGVQPLANSLRLPSEPAVPAVPLIICRCGECGTIQLTETVKPEVLFDHYVWVTGTSEGAKKYAETFADRMLERTEAKAPFVVEVASNDGTFLTRFQSRGCTVLGVDPAKNIAAMAEKDGVPTWAEFYGLEIARKIVAEKGHADIVMARNVIPHVADANDVIAGMAHVLKPEGTGAIEFHRADTILEELHYDSIYHEHLYYHSLHSLGMLLARHGLIPFDVAESPISGGSLVVYFAKTKRPESDALKAMVALEKELGVADEAPWLEFAAKSKKHRDTLRGMVEAKVAAGKKVIAYGASARSSTVLNYCDLGPKEVAALADRAPLKQGRLSPGTDVPIMAPADAFALKPDVVLILGWNFGAEIMSQIVSEQGWHGEVIMPLPGDPSERVI